MKFGVYSESAERFKSALHYAPVGYSVVFANAGKGRRIGFAVLAVTRVLHYHGGGLWKFISAESGICIIHHGEKGDEFGYFDKVLRRVYDPSCIASGDGKYLALSCVSGAYLIDIDNNTLSEIYMTDSKVTPDSLQKSILMPYPNVLGWKGDALLIDYPFESSAEHTADDPAHCYFSIDAETGEATELSQEPTDIETAPQYDKKTANGIISKYFKLFEENLNE